MSGWNGRNGICKRQPYSSGAWTTSDGPNGSHEAHNAFGGTNAEETWNMFLGDGYPDGSTQIMYTVSHADCPIGRWSLLTSESGITGRTTITTRTRPAMAAFTLLYADPKQWQCCSKRADLCLCQFIQQQLLWLFMGLFHSYKQQWYALLDCYRRNVTIRVLTQQQ